MGFQTEDSTEYKQPFSQVAPALFTTGRAYH